MTGRGTPVFLRVWRFRAVPTREREFIAAYGPGGDWHRLFSRAAGFLGTELLAAEAAAGEYLAVDRWLSSAAWEAFRRDHAAEYDALDRRCEALTEAEEHLGDFHGLSG